MFDVNLNPVNWGYNRLNAFFFDGYTMYQDETGAIIMGEFDVQDSNFDGFDKDEEII